MSSLKDIIDPELLNEISPASVIGLDIGSTTGKGVLLSHGRYYTAMVPTGVYAQPTADKLLKRLLDQSGLTLQDIHYIVGTGYGRISLDFGSVAHKVVTEISCHAMGAHYLDRNVRTIVDIGGQDAKAIKVDPLNGKVVEFIMNDKCAAGTGRFLEKAAYLLGITVEQLGQEALNADKPADISSQCVVFAESEVISLRAKGEKRENIAAGIHIATARRIRNQINRLGLSPNLVFSGGVSNNLGMWKSLEEVLGITISPVRLDTVFAGALGAAVYAQQGIAAGSDTLAATV